MKVAECRIKDVGKKKAITDRISMEKLGVADGDIVEIAGKKITAVSVFSFEDKTKKNSNIHIDGQTRQNAGISLNDYVLVKKIYRRPAERVVLSCNTTKNFSDEFNLYLNNRFEGYPVTKGEKFTLNFLGTSLEFKVDSTIPREVVKITKFTRIVIRTGIEKLIS